MNEYLIPTVSYSILYKYGTFSLFLFLLPFRLYGIFHDKTEVSKIFNRCDSLMLKVSVS